MKQDNELGLHISAKYNRIYVHRTTLKAIGNPEFVSLGMPEKDKMVLEEICKGYKIRITRHSHWKSGWSVTKDGGHRKKAVQRCCRHLKCSRTIL